MKTSLNNYNLKALTNRVLAYLIDILIVLLLSTIVSSIPLFKSNIDKYQILYDEYTQYLTDYKDTTTLLGSVIKDSIITDEEYNKIIENDKYMEIITPYIKDRKIKYETEHSTDTLKPEYEDVNISKDKCHDLTTSIENEYKKAIKEYDYKLQKKGVSNTLITLICTLLYFGLFQFLLKGQTIGKKILKIKIVSSNDKKLTIFNYLLRPLIINNIFLNAIDILLLMYTSKAFFQKADIVVDFLVSFIEALIIFMVITREDNRGLHDLICHTKVISINVEKNSKVIEAEVEAEPKQNKKKKANKNKSI